MNPIWAFFFKDKFRTPLSVYKMSFAELLVLGGIIFGIGFGLTKGVQFILNLELANSEVTEEAHGVGCPCGSVHQQTQQF